MRLTGTAKVATWIPVNMLNATIQCDAHSYKNQKFSSHYSVRQRGVCTFVQDLAEVRATTGIGALIDNLWSWRG
jgi:hypothetical protein